MAVLMMCLGWRAGPLPTTLRWSSVAAAIAQWRLVPLVHYRPSRHRGWRARRPYLPSMVSPSSNRSPRYLGDTLFANLGAVAAAVWQSQLLGLQYRRTTVARTLVFTHPFSYGGGGIRRFFELRGHGGLVQRQADVDRGHKYARHTYACKLPASHQRSTQNGNNSGIGPLAGRTRERCVGVADKNPYARLPLQTAASCKTHSHWQPVTNRQYPDGASGPRALNLATHGIRSTTRRGPCRRVRGGQC